MNGRARFGWQRLTLTVLAAAVLSVVPVSAGKKCDTPPCSGGGGDGGGSDPEPGTSYEAIAWQGANPSFACDAGVPLLEADTTGSPDRPGVCTTLGAHTILKDKNMGTDFMDCFTSPTVLPGADLVLGTADDLTINHIVAFYSRDRSSTEIFAVQFYLHSPEASNSLTTGVLPAHSIPAPPQAGTDFTIVIEEPGVAIVTEGKGGKSKPPLGHLCIGVIDNELVQ